MAETITEERAQAYSNYLTGKDYQECADETSYSFGYVLLITTRKRWNEEIVNDLNSRLRRAVLKAEKQIKLDKQL